MVHMRRGGVDLQDGGGDDRRRPVGSVIGAALFRVLQSSGQIDLVIGLLYVLLLGGIGGLMLKDALVALGWLGASAPTSAAAPQPLGRLASAALAVSTLRPLHLAARALASASAPAC